MALFKYLPLERGLRVLAECELMVTPPRYLNDPFEGSPVVNSKDPDAYARRRFDEITKSREFFEKHKAEIPVGTFEEFQSAFERIFPQLVERMVAETPAIDSHIQSQAPEIISKNFGVICFAADGVHQTMWAHYASSNEGLVIEFRQSHQLFSGPSFFEVEYSDERVVFDPSNPTEGDKATVHNLPEGCRYFGHDVIDDSCTLLSSVRAGATFDLCTRPHEEDLGITPKAGAVKTNCSYVPCW